MNERLNVDGLYARYVMANITATPRSSSAFFLSPHETEAESSKNPAIISAVSKSRYINISGLKSTNKRTEPIKVSTSTKPAPLALPFDLAPLIAYSLPASLGRKRFALAKSKNAAINVTAIPTNNNMFWYCSEMRKANIFFPLLYNDLI